MEAAVWLHSSTFYSEQQTRKDLDIVTGFQLLDGKHHLFILEGLANGAIQMVWGKMGKPKQGEDTRENSMSHRILYEI